jgi:16S rRNA (cytosine1402-N4)-methyltransferase
MKHISVMTREILEHARITTKSRVIDGTLGSGGHSREIAKRLGTTGVLVCIDRDAQSLARVQEQGITCRGIVHYIHGNFVDAHELVPPIAGDLWDAIILDLGWSMDQFADPNRGFSFMVDGELDMRLDYPGIGPTAREIIAEYSERDLADLFYNLADERNSRAIARAIVMHRKHHPIITTFDLVRVVETVSKRYGKTHPATKVFQALRIAVNHELSDILSGLENMIQLLAPGGRLLVLTFHSIEDRIVKQECARLAQNGLVKVITKKPIPPTTEEQRTNSRSRSALLRIIEKI